MTASPTLVAGRYRLIETLGVGGMGRVWHAWDQTLGRDVAIKEIVPPVQLLATERDELRRRTLREARAAARLNHPSVVRVYDVFETNGRPWIVMEFVQARSLHDILAADGPLDPVRAAGIGLALLGALRAAHRAGVMHRDVKPSNVLLSDDGRVVLTDFGIATLEGDPGVTRPGLVLGSPAYISPERARDGTAGPESDLWSLGATLYAAVEGKAPFERNSAIATLTALASEEVEPPRNAGALRWVLNGLLRKDPEARIDAAEAERRLRRAATGGPAAVAARKFRWPWTKASGAEFRPPRQGGAEGPVSGGPAPGAPVSGGPVAGRPVAGGPVAGRPVAGPPVAGGPVADGRPGSELPGSDGPVAGGRPGGGSAVARGRAAAPGAIAPGSVGGHNGAPDRSGSDGTGQRDERSDGSRSGRRSGSPNGTGPVGTGSSGTGSAGARPRGSAAVPTAGSTRAPSSPAPMPRGPEPTAPVSAPRVPAARSSTAPGVAAGGSPSEGRPDLSAPAAALAGTAVPQVEAPTAPVSGPRSAPPSWPVPRFEPIVGRPTAPPDPPAVPVQRPSVEDAVPTDPAAESVAVEVPAEASPSAADATTADPVDATEPDQQVVDTEANQQVVATEVDQQVGAAEADTQADPIVDRAVESAPESVASSGVESGPDAGFGAGLGEEPGREMESAAGPGVKSAAEPDLTPSPDASGTSVGADAAAVAGVGQAAGSGKGRAGKGRKGRNRRGRNREPEATQPAAVAEDPMPMVVAGQDLESVGTNTNTEAVAPEATAPEASAPGSTAPAITVPGAAAQGAAVPEAATPEAPAPKASAPEAATPEAPAPEASTPRAAAPEAPAPEAAAADRSAQSEPAAAMPAAAVTGATPAEPAAEEPTTVVAAPGLALLGKRARRVPEAAESPTRTTVNPAASEGTGGRVRALAKVVRPEPGQDDRRKRILVLAVAAVILIAAIVFMATRNTEGDPVSKDQGASPTGPAATQQPTSEPASPPPTSTPADAATAQPGNAQPGTAQPGRQRPPLPAGWRLYTDRTGFSVYVPAHWVESRKGTMVYFRGDGRVLGIDETNQPKADPVADWQEQRDVRRGRGEFPGYSEIKIAEVVYFNKAADWEFTYNDNGGRRHVSNRGVIVGPKQAHGFWWETAEADWAAAAPVLQIVYESFEPNPSRVG